MEVTMRKGRPIPVLTMSPEERETLERWARRPKTAQALAQRAQIILNCGERQNQHGSGAALAPLETDGWQMAAALHS